MSRVKDEPKPVKPASVEQDVFIQTQKTADFLMRQVEEVLKPHHLSPTQYNALRILRGAGNEGLSCSDVASRMITRDPDMTRLLDRLEDRDLLTRQREKEDRRVIRTRISPEGLRLLKQLDEPIRSTHKDQLGHMSSKRLRLLSRLLERARTPETD